MPHPMLSPLPYKDWERTKTTLHLWCQIVGKIKLRCTPHRNHWWNITLHPTTRGLSTLRMRSGDTFFEIEFDLIDRVLVVRTATAREAEAFPLTDGLSVAEFYEKLFAALARLNIHVRILARPYDMGVTTPFALDREHRTFDGVAARRWWEIVLWSADVLDRFAAEFLGKASPAHIFWHTFDLASARYSGRPGSVRDGANEVEREAYKREVIAFGFWPGDAKTPMPAYYTYTAPEPEALAREPLRPGDALWVASGSGHLGVLAYETVRAAADPAATLTEFWRSGYEAGTRSAAWGTEALVDDFQDRQRSKVTR